MPNKKLKVFISSTYSDLKNKEQLKNSILTVLHEQNIVYFDDQQILPGEKWATKIQNALEDASVFILILSKNFRSSEQKMYELGHAIARSQEAGAKVIPIITNKGDIPEFVRQFNYIDASSLKPDEVKSKLVSVLEEEPKAQRKSR